MARRKQIEKNGIETADEEVVWVDDIYRYQKKYFKTIKGKEAREKAQKKYDRKNAEKRRKQKRDYMRKKRLEDPDIWRY